MAKGQRARRRRKGRPKRIPMRTCIACREANDKRTLARLVRTPAGVYVDSTGKRAGRGAYLHSRPECWARALDDLGIVNRALKTELTGDDADRLREFASGIATASVDGE